MQLLHLSLWYELHSAAAQVAAEVCLMTTGQPLHKGHSPELINSVALAIVAFLSKVAFHILDQLFFHH